MAKNKKDRRDKKYVPRKPGDIKLKYEPWRLVGVFAAPLQVIDLLERGEMLVENDVPVFRDIDDGKLYETLPALAGFIELFELYATRYRNPLPLDPLRVLYRKLADESEVIDSDDTTAARTSLEAVRRALLELTRGQADELLSDYHLKEAMAGNIM